MTLSIECIGDIYPSLTDVLSTILLQYASGWTGEYQENYKVNIIIK